MFESKMLVSLSFATALSFTSAFAAEPAPTGFDGETNGLVDQTTHEADLEVFVEQEFIADGLGPVFNAQSCGECHQNPVSGGISQVTEVRAGREVRGRFTPHPGDTLIHSRAIDASVQERVHPSSNVTTERTSLNTLGDGFVEAIADDTLRGIAAAQPRGMRGEVIEVPLLEAPGATRVGRFGWKNQQASLVSFSADAYLNEMGITTPFLPVENTSNGASIAAYDTVPDPEDDGVDVEVFARFMRATKAPPRDADLAATQEARRGEDVFRRIGCEVCHVSTIVTAPVGTVVNGGTFTVPEALADKTIQPFGDFLLHDVGTGDGILQNGPPSTRNKVRTPPLWGVRTRNRLMHDGGSLTFNDAILRHRGEAAAVTQRYQRLSDSDRASLIRFLESL